MSSPTTQQREGSTHPGPRVSGSMQEGEEELRAALLSVKDLAVSLGGRQVLRDIELDIHEGEFIGLIGPNGAGKTTLLRAILGLIPAHGAMSIAGATHVRARRHAVGYVPQRHEFAWDFPISVHDCVLNARGIGSRGWWKPPRTEDYAAVAAALERVRLTDLDNRPIAELSGGQRQRVLVARALVNSPKLLLLDEPFSGLDMPSAELLVELFQSLAAEGTAIVMSTHNLGEAMDACSRVVLLNGELKAVGTPAQLHNPSVWMDTFAVSAHSPLLRTVGINPSPKEPSPKEPTAKEEAC